MPRPAIIGLALLVACTLAACDSPNNAGPSDPTVDAGRHAIETQLVPTVTIAGDDASDRGIEDQLAAYDVPAVSIAVVRDGEIAWAAAYGADVDPASLFQAASLSKAVAAAGILALARERGFDIDADLTGQLGSFDLAAINPEGRTVSLRGLLSHTAGATIHGYPGYPVGTPLPDTLEIVTGAQRTNTPAVAIDFDPEHPWRYSGGGYEIAQLWAEQASGEDFAALIQRLVLDPVGMSSSSFALNGPDGIAEGRIARAHGWNGEPIDGGWHLYPEQAAANLWTTPSDYGRFLIALMAASDGAQDRGIDPEIAHEMTTAISDDYGLGIGTSIHLGERRWDHSGSAEGYRCNLIALPSRGDAIIVMTNGNNAQHLIPDINRTAEIAYDWPHDPPRTESRFDMPAARLAEIAGSYTTGGNAQPIMQLDIASRDLRGLFGGYVHFRLVPISADRLVDPVDGQDFVFALEDGVMVARADGQVFSRLPDE
ncbi:serine hydrolase domain-containing protein [uncultured Maricaulis sp.]|uniref:serine hydrolase domain-containing protein n=1 Tax=uncultured Maricaulis sp. TaxID=174710 RepID=UPI0030D929F8